MRNTIAVGIAALSIFACNASKPGAGEKKEGQPMAKEAPKEALSKTPDPDVIAHYCAPGPEPVALTAMKDSAGNIGGYIFRRLIMDSPVFYLDAKGKDVAMFHIFGSPEEKQKNGPLIDALRAAYPIEENIPCPGQDSAPRGMP